jgi:2-iminobutanoate/2-iminopropanoate deaminase
MMAKSVFTSNAPEPIGPYSQAMVQGGYVFCSGQLGIVPVSGSLVSDSASQQAEQALKNLREVLVACNSDLGRVVKVTLYLTDLRDFSSVNEAYARYLGDVRPARTTVQVQALPKGALVAMDAIASL